MSVEVKINYAQIISRMKAKSGNAAKAVAEQIIHDTEKYVPKLAGDTQNSGDLRASAIIHGPQKTDDGYAAVWDGPYAAFQWYGCWPDGSHVVKNHTTPGTTTQWVETAKAEYGAAWEKVAQNAKEKM